MNWPFRSLRRKWAARRFRQDLAINIVGVTPFGVWLCLKHDVLAGALASDPTFPLHGSLQDVADYLSRLPALDVEDFIIVRDLARDWLAEQVLYPREP